jgi:hypothetical protein
MKRIVLLLVLALFTVTTAAAQDDLPLLTYGVPGEFEITGADAVSFTFEGTAGDVIYMTQHSPSDSSDATMRLFSARGALVGESFSLGDGQVLEPITLADTGRYTVSMQRPPESGFTGSVSVLVDKAVIQDVTLPLEITAATFGAEGQTLIFSIPVEKNTLFGWWLACEVCAAALKPPNGTDWMTWGLSDFVEMPLMLLADPGTYTLYVQNRVAGSEYSLGAYQPEPEPLTVNEPLTGTIEHFETHVFSFTSAAGKVWQINSSIPDGNRQMDIRQLEGRAWWDTVLDYDDGSGPNGNARIQSFIAPADGTYYVLLRWASWSDDGSTRDFEITLQPDTLRQLVPGTTFNGVINAETGNVRYLYDGTAGETLTITLERTSETGSPFLGIYSPSDEVAVFSGRSASYVQVKVTLPEDGRYEFILSDISYDNPSGLTYSIVMQAGE